MLTRESGYRRTMTACFLGYIVQATICTLAPLLYARFQTEYQIPLGRISLMITLTFAIQTVLDWRFPEAWSISSLGAANFGGSNMSTRRTRSAARVK